MADYILIDRASGFIWADTRDFSDMTADIWRVMRRRGAATPAVAAWLADFSADRTVQPRDLKGYGPLAQDGTDRGYGVYAVPREAPILPVVVDGQDAAAIEAVERRCRFLGVYGRQGV